MAKREFLQLAHTYKPAKYGLAGWFASEKLDGMRGFWDGGISRGIPKADIPWANNDKDERYVTPPVATGLWSRYGNVIHAPDWWLNMLPAIMLDGELYTKDYRQELMKIVKSLVPDEESWEKVQYHVFDIVPRGTVFCDGEVKDTNFKKIFKDVHEWTDPFHLQFDMRAGKQYQDVVTLMDMKLTENEVLKIHEQTRLPINTTKAHEMAMDMCEEIVSNGGEGLMVRSDAACYMCKRSHNLLKMKPTEDMEGTVTGYITGRKTDLGSKLLGMMGALILKLDDGIRLELSGFTDDERSLGGFDESYKEDDYQVHATEWAIEHPETECPDWVYANHFPRGARVTFKYRGLTKDGVPQEARYWRHHESNET